MALSRKHAKAIETMTSSFGFPKETVKPILQDLLKKCKGKWKPIEDDNYEFLVNAILDSEQKRVEEEKELQKSSEDFITDGSPVPLALILQEKSGFNNSLDDNCSRPSGTNLLEMMDVDDEFDDLPSPPCEEGVDIETLVTNQMNGGGVQDVNLDQICLSSIPDSPCEPHSPDLTHWKYDLNLKTISNGESEGVDDKPSNGSSTPRPLMIMPRENKYFVEDITRGEEEEKISLINEVNSDELPTFRYIPRSIPYCNAQVIFPLVHISENNCCSSCLADCLSSKTPCSCAKKSPGGFAYRTGGVVKDRFIDKCVSMNHKSQQKKLSFSEVSPLERLTGQYNGHVIRNFIKECWHKCGCSKNCGNRTVQRGVTAKLQVFMTPEGKGWGLRTLEDLPKGAFICEYVGEIITTMELVERNMRNMDKQQTYSVLLDADWRSKGGLKDEEALWLDGESYGNVARFINHRCHDANMIEIPVEVETPNHNYYHVAFFTTRKVKAMEELTWDYGINFSDDSQPWKVFQCCCGSDFCRGKKMMKTSDICAREPCSDLGEKIHTGGIQYYTRKKYRKTVTVD